MKSKIIWVTLFAIAMGFLETAIVVYLRELFYPEGFNFPLKSMKSYLIITELFREAATLIMIFGMAMVAGNNRHNRFAWFIYIFAVWDIFYYVFLKVILNWPVSWITWDVLFLIPCLWVGPVLAPVILSLLMIWIWAIVIYFDQKASIKIRTMDYLLIGFGCIIQIVNFCWDNLNYVINAPSKSNLHILHLSYIPNYFNWWIFTFGCLVIGIAIVNITTRNIALTNRLKIRQLF